MPAPAGGHRHRLLQRQPPGGAKWWSRGCFGGDVVFVGVIWFVLLLCFSGRGTRFWLVLNEVPLVCVCAFLLGNVS